LLRRVVCATGVARSVGKRVRAISAARVRGRQALATLDRLTAEIAERAKQTLREARSLARSARRNARRRRASAAQPARRRDQQTETGRDAGALGLRRPRLRHQHG
jgi:hypothetical protein